MMTIAVCLDEFNQTATLDTATHIELYTNQDQVWNLTGSFLFSTKNTSGMAQFRQLINDLIQSLAATKIIVFKQLIGLSYSLLDNAGFHIWEFDEEPIKFLDFIALKEKELSETSDSNVKAEKPSTTRPDNVTPFPLEPDALFTDLGSGKYFCNLKQLLQDSPHLTTKKVLMPFLNNISFYELELIVDHIPPWLTTLQTSYSITTTDLEHRGKQLTITQLTCNS